MTSAAPPTQNPLLERLGEIAPEALAPVLADLGIEAHELADARAPLANGERSGLLLPLSAGTLPVPERERHLREFTDARVAEQGWLLLYLTGRRTERELAAWRNQLWPLFHVGAIYRLLPKGQAERWTLSGRRPFDLGEVKAGRVHVGSLLCAQRRLCAMAPAATVTKFDANAAGWNGFPGTAGYAHFRWMRRYVARFARPRPGARVLDFGCGAGWVGIEAAHAFRAASLRAFDPSPEMVRIATENARAEGLVDFAAAPGFGEAPPFPAPGEAPYDLVLSSGVISFAPDPELWLAGLDRTVASGGQLVIGDIEPSSFGFRRRRAARPLLPARELHAQAPATVRAWLEARGYTHRKSAGYQLTFPFPELAHHSERRLKGLLNPPLLLANRLLAGRLPAPCFDSWVMRFDKAR